MNILFDARWIRTDAPSDGLSRYSSNLIHELAKRDDINLTILIYDKAQLGQLPEVAYLMANNPAQLYREFFIARLINPHHFDIVYSPSFFMGSYGRRYRLVLTIHDLIFFTYQTPPQWLAWDIRLKWRLFHSSLWPMRRFLNSADAVATVSQTARQELAERRMTRRPVSIVSNAVAHSFRDNSPADHASSRHVVYMGAFTPYKNAECLIQAIAQLPGMILDLCSKIPAKRRQQLEAFIAQCGVSDRVIIHDGVSDQQYRQLLRSARCLATASRAEGFGLPIIEAQHAGVPVVCSDTPIFREVGGEGALYFDPRSLAHAAAQIERLADPELSRQMIRQGLQNTNRYSWAKSAEQVVAICHRVRGQQPHRRQTDAPLDGCR